MALNLTIKDIAYEIFSDEISSDSNFSEASICAWIRNQAIGKLNNSINTSFVLSEDTLEISPQLNENQKVILKGMFMIYYFGFLTRLNLGAAQTTITEISDTLGGKIRMVDRNSISKTYKDLQKDAEQTLKDMIAQYKINSIEPLDIQGKDNTGDSSSLIDPYGKRSCN